MTENHPHHKCMTEAVETSAAAREAKSLLGNLWTHDIEHRLKIRRKSEAMAMGLGDIDVGTYPSHPASNTVVHNNGGFLKGALLAAGLLGAGGLGTVGMQMLTTAGATGENSVVQTPALQAPPESSKPHVPGQTKVTPIEFDLLIESVEGEIKATVEP